MKTLEAMEKVILGKTIRPNSVKNYQKVFARLAKYTEDFPSAPGYLNEYFSAISKILAPQTVRLHYRVIKSAATYLEGNYGTINPFKKPNTDIVMVKMPHADKVPRRYYNAEQLGLIIRACKTERDLALVSALIDSGCRVEDLASLKSSDIDNTGFNTHKGKTGGHHYRLDPQIRSMLKQLAGSEDNYVFQLCHLGSNSKYEYVPGLPTTANALSYRIRRICINAGFTGAKLGAHTLRHVYYFIGKEPQTGLE
jgi:integrase